MFFSHVISFYFTIRLISVNSWCVKYSFSSSKIYYCSVCFGSIILRHFALSEISMLDTSILSSISQFVISFLAKCLSLIS